MKERRQGIARISNELHRRKVRRKATREERAIIQNRKVKLNDDKLDSNKLKLVKEQWLDKLRYKKRTLKEGRESKVASCTSETRRVSSRS